MWNKEKDIFALMAGHGTQVNGKWDSGCVYGKYTEAELVLAITKVAVKELRRCGVRVISDADTNNNRNMVSCVKWANSTKGVKYYMSVHVDYKLATPGVAPLYVSKAGKEMAVTVGKYVAKAMGMKWKGAFHRTNLYELNATSMPSVIFECGAIKADLDYLKKSEEYGMALADGILKLIGVTKPKKKKHTNAWRLRKSAKVVTKYMAEHNFKYKASWTDNAMSWKGAKKKKTTNCSDMVSYALQRIGILKEGQIFWINGKKITCKGGLTLDELKKKATILHPNHSPKHAHLHKGDICGYGENGNAHTMIFAGFNEKGVATWYSTGSTTEIGKGKAHVKKTYSNRVIDTIIRLK